MKNILPLIAVAGLAAPAFSQSVSASPEPFLHLRASFDLVVHLPYPQAAPLFGPDEERVWAGEDWNPQFIYPQPAADVEGAVFTISHGKNRAVWVTSLLDLDARRIQYVYFLPDLMVTVIDVSFKPLGPDSTAVNVVYTRTALTPQGNEHVTTMQQHDQSAKMEWQQALDEYLAGRKSADRH